MKKSALLFLALLCAITLATWFSWPVHAQRTASNPLGAQLNVQDAGTCSTSNSFAWQTLPINAGTTTLNLSGTFTATITVRESNNGGGSWSTAATLTTTGTTTYNTNGFTDFCADVTAFTSGIVQVSIATGTIVTGVVGGNVAGLNTQVQFNNNGAFGASANLTFSGGILQVNNTVLAGIPGSATGQVEIVSANSGNNVLLTSPTSGTLSVPAYATGSNCSNSGGTCGSAAAGAVSIAAAASTVTVATTAVTANSDITLTRNDALSTRLSVTCNTATAAGDIKVSTITAGTSFVITVQNAPATNPLCLTYTIVN